MLPAQIVPPVTSPIVRKAGPHAGAQLVVVTSPPAASPAFNAAASRAQQAVVLALGFRALQLRLRPHTLRGRTLAAVAQGIDVGRVAAVERKQADHSVQRQAKLSDAVVISIKICSCGEEVEEVLCTVDHLLYTVGSQDAKLPLPHELVTDALISMRECDSRSGLYGGAVWTLKLEQVCGPRGESLATVAACTRQHGLESKVRSLLTTGIVALSGVEDGGLTPEELAFLQATTFGTFDRTTALTGTNWNPNLRCSDAATRGAHRLHIKLDDLTHAAELPSLGPGSRFNELLCAAFGTSNFRLTFSGALVAKPASDGLVTNLNQRWHRDALVNEPELAKEWDPYAVAVFVPLIDVHGDNGATEFILGTHKCGTDVADFWEKDLPADRLAHSAGLRAGDIIIYDMRTAHRGLLHSAPQRGHGELGIRAVVTMNFGVADWTDKEAQHNWGSDPVAEEPKTRRELVDA